MKKLFKVAFLCAISLIVLTGCGSKVPKFGMNEPVEVTNNNGKYVIEVVDVTTTTSTQKDSNGKKVVVFKVKVSNTANSDELIQSDMHFTAVDKKGNKLVAYDKVSPTAVEVKKGKEATFNVGYLFDNEENYAKLTFMDNIATEKPTALFEIEW